MYIVFINATLWHVKDGRIAGIVGMHGYCLGGGLQLALACDIRVSTLDCQIGLPAIRESLIPGLSTWRLPRYVGW
ncbi:MAG: enoyl-CoA hydratase-related protein, partial [Desulfobacterales bacterium]